MTKRKTSQDVAVQPPPTIYAYWSDGNIDSGWFEAAESIEACATEGETRLVGEYKLVKTHEVSLVVSEKIVAKDSKAKT